MCTPHSRQLGLLTEDLPKIKPINSPAQVKEAHKPPAPAEELFIADGFQSRDSHFSLGMWSLVGHVLVGGSPWAAQIGPGGLLKKRESKERPEAERKCEGATQEKLEEGEGEHDQITLCTSVKFSKNNLKLILYVEIER